MTTHYSKPLRSNVVDGCHSDFYLPDRACNTASNAIETWPLVQNPNTTAVQVRVSYLPNGGSTPLSFTTTVAANSRVTYKMANKMGAFAHATVMVECLTADKKIAVERAMYWNNKGAGSDTIGGYSD